MDGYFPLSEGEDTCSGSPDVARFGQFLAWRCERGAEVVFGGEHWDVSAGGGWGTRCIV